MNELVPHRADALAREIARLRGEARLLLDEIEWRVARRVARVRALPTRALPVLLLAGAALLAGRVLRGIRRG